MAVGILFLLLALLILLLVKAVPLPSGEVRLKVLNIAQVLATATGVVGVANGLVQLTSWWRRSTKPSPAPAPADIDKAKDVLAGLVTEQWRNETVLRSLGHPQPIPVPWRSTEHAELMDHPRLIAKGALSFPSLSDHIANMAKDFRALRCRRLVIIGGPGTGKTTLAVQLLMELLRTRLPGEPVPVLLSATRWNTETHPRLQDWLAECLGMDYPALHAEGFGPDTARALATRSEVLPILDGLDELPAEARAGILTALNRSMCDSDQLILTCRTTQFAESVEAVGDVLAAAAVIESHPLSTRAAADYLQACLPARLHPTWPRVLDALRRGAAPALAEVATTPLGLWLVRAAYITSRQDPSPLLELGRGDPSILNDHLCDQLIPALVSSRPPADDPTEPFRPRHAWDPEQVRQWLTYLSQLLGRDSYDVAWWRLARYTPTRSVRTAVSLTCGLVVGIMIGVLTEMPVAGAATGLISAIAVMIMIRSWFTELPGYADFRLHGRLLFIVRSLRDGLVVGLLGALVGWLMSRGQASGALMIGLLSWLGFMFTVGLIRWVEYPTDTAKARSPRSTWQADRNLTLIRALSGLIIGLMGGVIGLYAGISPPTALVGGLLLGLLFGLMLGSHHAWLAYNLTVPRLATKGRLPLRAMCFLDDAHRLGLLRTEGPFYQFRNFELQKHLARQCRVESGSGERRQMAPQPPQ
ncbi:NACHT domain-containing protein [Microtetraspora sp. NBRC 16547]|uniref:NACHT domain-containing protein n=1 Tax=Microtetraspora sp. NBRC 16547 TaxID=3030993 RepID=UPI0024A2AABA|nr:NACHT domain-containing protein [Microtetraspora sp. NBRC 16547]GLX00245.1 NACHT domain-containing protein [Microtetraspora sp. NBRC 16547]